MSKDFYVDTEALTKVGQQIQNLLERINSTDASKGTLHDLQENGASIDAATTTFWDGPNALATAYSHELDYVIRTYGKLTEQLTAVQNACVTTASQFHGKEQKSKHDVRTNTEL